MTRIACFAGPSLPGAPVVPPDVVLWPPARGGDLLRARRDGYAAVALVDGLFETAPTVGHKEILHLLGEGVPVLGAASLGAIRAAELDRYGMIGVGAVYAAYRDGRIERDDAVMVAHAPAELGHRALTVALVDAEATIAAASLDPEDGRALLRIARACPFRRRDWPTLLARFAADRGSDRAAAAERALGVVATSVKQADAAALLARLAEPLAPPRAAPPPRTLFLQRLLEHDRPQQDHRSC